MILTSQVQNNKELLIDKINEDSQNDQLILSNLDQLIMNLEKQQEESSKFKSRFPLKQDYEISQTQNSQTSLINQIESASQI